MNTEDNERSLFSFLNSTCLYVKYTSICLILIGNNINIIDLIKTTKENFMNIMIINEFTNKKELDLFFNEFMQELIINPDNFNLFCEIIKDNLIGFKEEYSKYLLSLHSQDYSIDDLKEITIHMFQKNLNISNIEAENFFNFIQSNTINEESKKVFGFLIATILEIESKKMRNQLLGNHESKMKNKMRLSKIKVESINLKGNSSDVKEKNLLKFYDSDDNYSNNSMSNRNLKETANLGKKSFRNIFDKFSDKETFDHFNIKENKNLKKKSSTRPKSKKNFFYESKINEDYNEILNINELNNPFIVASEISKQRPNLGVPKSNETNNEFNGEDIKVASNLDLNDDENDNFNILND